MVANPNVHQGNEEQDENTDAEWIAERIDYSYPISQYKKKRKENRWFVLFLSKSIEKLFQYDSKRSKVRF